MTDETLEGLVAAYVERREEEPGLTASSFAAEHGALELELLERLARLESVESLFPSTVFTRPETIGPWRVVGELGRGGSGRVYRVVDTRPGATAGLERACKRLAPELGADERARERIRREARLLAALDHPGLVRVLEVDAGADEPWIVMEKIDGESLAQRLSRTKSGSGAPDLFAGRADPWIAAARLGAEVALALRAAHRAGLLHRDVKPSNVILGPGDRAVLIDFGLGTDADSRTLTRTGDLIGTPQYMAPEQARGERATVQTDVWGVGALLYEIITSRPPSDERSGLAAIERLRRRRPARLCGGSASPVGLARIVDRALAFRPARRYPDMEGLASDLLRFADGLSVRAPRPSPMERVEDAFRARPWVGVLALAVLLGAVILGSLGTLLGDGGGAEDAYRAARHDVVLAWVERDGDGLREAAVALQGLGFVGEASFAQALAGDGALPVAGPEPLVRELARAEAARRRGDHEAALAGFSRASGLSGKWALPCVALGRTAREAGDMERAAAEWQAAIRLAPDSASLHRRLGKVRRRLGDVDGAIECFRVAASLAPGDWRNHGELGRALATIEGPKTKEEALREVRRSLELKGEPVRVLQNVEAAILDSTGHPEEARKIHLAILERSPNHAGTWFNLGLTWLQDLQPDEAVAAFKESISLDASGYRCQVWLARLHSGQVETHWDADRWIRGVVARRGGRPETLQAELSAWLADHRDSGATLDHLTAALVSGDRESIRVLQEAVDLAEASGMELDVAEILEGLVEDRDIDETSVRWAKAARLLRQAGGE